MSGTPYNNREQDLATLMTFIDPSLPSAREAWWQKATKDGAAARVVEAVKEWSQSYMVRRDKEVLGELLPKKTISTKPISAHPMELDVYESYEQNFLQVLERFQRLTNDTTPLVGWRILLEAISFLNVKRTSLTAPHYPICTLSLSRCFRIYPRP